MKLFLGRNFFIVLSISTLFFACSKEIEQIVSKNFTLNEIESGAAPVYNAPANGSPIKDAYIVVFKDDVIEVDQVIDALSRQGGFKSKFRYKNTIKGFAASIPAQALEGISRNTNVKYIEQDQEVKLEATQTGATWGIDRIDQTSLPLSGSYTYSSTASGVDAYIFDTGIRFDHVQFGGRAISGYDAFGGNGLDGHGHGTHVSGTVGGSTYGVAKGVRLIAVRVLDNTGSGSWSGVIAGIDWAATNHTTNPAVGNMSLGGGASTSVDDAVRRAVADGIVMCVAAGNSTANAANYSPARTSEAITVAATTSSDGFASYSNYGSVVDILAPGSSITSSYYTSSTATASMSGTSMATPHVAGAAALYLVEFPGSTPASVQTGLKNRAVQGKITGVPTGTVNALLQNFAPVLPTVAPSQPTLSIPTAGATGVSTNVTFSWTAASNAQTYTLQVSKTSDFTSGVLTYNTSNISQAVTGLSQATVYYWKVIANNIIGTATSSTRSFTTLLNAPNLVSPVNSAKNVSRTPLLSWSSISAANGYDIQLSTASNYSSAINYTSSTNSITVSPTLAAQTLYYWRVRSKQTTPTVTSSWSSSFRFTTSL